MAQPQPFQPGDLLGGRYRLKHIIGTGGMGAVWAARNETTDRDFAIKVLHPSQARDPFKVQRFLQEAKSAGRVRHPAVAEVYDMGRVESGDHLPYLVMELLDGEPLSDFLRAKGVIAPGAAAWLLAECASAVEAAHRAGVLHRDIKPANIFLHETADGRLVPKLLDFGISKLTDPEGEGGLTQTGMVLGTPSYMSPEQMGAQSIDARSDVWALGVVLYQCLAGRLPFRGDDMAATYLAARHGPPAPLAGTPPELAAIAMKCLEKSPDERFATAEDLAASLRALLPSLEPPHHIASSTSVPALASPVPASTEVRPRYRRLALGGVALALLVISVGLATRPHVREEAAAATPAPSAVETAPSAADPPPVADPLPVPVTPRPSRAEGSALPPRARSPAVRPPRPSVRPRTRPTDNPLVTPF